MAHGIKKVAHTSGPWTVEGRGTTIKMGNRAFAGVDQNEGVPFSEARANACLIAAAPDLLDALELAEFALEGKRHDEDPTLKKIRAALAKARGES